MTCQASAWCGRPVDVDRVVLQRLSTVVSIPRPEIAAAVSQVDQRAALDLRRFRALADRAFPPLAARLIEEVGPDASVPSGRSQPNGLAPVPKARTLIHC
jgi:hypothetical protein